MNDESRRVSRFIVHHSSFSVGFTHQLGREFRRASAGPGLQRSRWTARRLWQGLSAYLSPSLLLAGICGCGAIMPQGWAFVKQRLPGVGSWLRLTALRSFSLSQVMPFLTMKCLPERAGSLPTSATSHKSRRFCASHSRAEDPSAVSTLI